MREGFVFKPQPIGYRVKREWDGEGIEGLRRRQIEFGEGVGENARVTGVCYMARVLERCG